MTTIIGNVDGKAYIDYESDNYYEEGDDLEMPWYDDKSIYSEIYTDAAEDYFDDIYNNYVFEDVSGVIYPKPVTYDMLLAYEKEWEMKEMESKQNAEKINKMDKKGKRWNGWNVVDKSNKILERFSENVNKGIENMRSIMMMKGKERREEVKAYKRYTKKRDEKNVEKGNKNKFFKSAESDNWRKKN